jgi:hypothetical protein
MPRTLLNLLLALLLLLPPGVCACQFEFGGCAAVEEESETPGSPCPDDHVHTSGCLATPGGVTPSAELPLVAALLDLPFVECGPLPTQQPLAAPLQAPTHPARHLFVSHCSFLI